MSSSKGCLSSGKSGGQPYNKGNTGPAFKSRLGVGHRNNRTGANSPNPARAVAALSSTVRFELGVAFSPGRLRVALRRLVLYKKKRAQCALVPPGWPRGLLGSLKVGVVRASWITHVVHNEKQETKGITITGITGSPMGPGTSFWPLALAL